MISAPHFSFLSLHAEHAVWWITRLDNVTFSKQLKFVKTLNQSDFCFSVQREINWPVDRVRVMCIIIEYDALL